MDIQKTPYDIYTELQACLKSQVGLFFRIGYLLKTIRDEKIYEKIGDGGFDTFIDFLNNPEIGLRQSTAYLYIRIYEYYFLQLKIPQQELIEMPISRLMKLLPALKKMPDEKAIETIQRIAPLTSYDYDVEVRENNLETERPKLYVDKESGLYIFEFRIDQMKRIINTETKEIIYEC